jgi:hypothetical protein
MIKYIFAFLLLTFSQYGFTKPYITTKFKLDNNNHTQLQVTNKESYKLLCYVAIDGYKIYFYLKPKQKSIWYRATDKRFNHTHFSTKCVDDRIPR